MFCLSLTPPVDGRHAITKNPRLAGNRGLFGNLLLVWLEVSSHDASAAILPNGHLSLGSLAAQADIKRSRHLLTAILNTRKKHLSSVSTSLTPLPWECRHPSRRVPAVQNFEVICIEVLADLLLPARRADHRAGKDARRSQFPRD